MQVLFLGKYCSVRLANCTKKIVFRRRFLELRNITRSCGSILRNIDFLPFSAIFRAQNVRRSIIQGVISQRQHFPNIMRSLDRGVDIDLMVRFARKQNTFFFSRHFLPPFTSSSVSRCVHHGSIMHFPRSAMYLTKSAKEWCPLDFSGASRHICDSLLPHGPPHFLRAPQRNFSGADPITLTPKQ